MPSALVGGRRDEEFSRETTMGESFQGGSSPPRSTGYLGSWGRLHRTHSRAAAGDSGSSPTVALPSVGKPLASLSHQLPSGPGPVGLHQRLSNLFWLQATVSCTLDTQPSPFYMSCIHIF